MPKKVPILCHFRPPRGLIYDLFETYLTYLSTCDDLLDTYLCLGAPI